MTPKQTEQFKAMATIIKALVDQVTLLTSDIAGLTETVNEIGQHPALSIPPLATHNAEPIS